MEENDFEIVIEPKLHIEMDRLKNELLKTQFELQKTISDMEYLKNANATFLKTIHKLTKEKSNLTGQNGLLINQKNTLQAEVQELKAKKILMTRLLPNNNLDDNIWVQKPMLNPQHLFNKSPLYKLQSKLRKRRNDRY
jgi:hypothetical protein